MAKVSISKKACTVNPLKMSQPIGGALAFMGVKGCMPLLVKSVVGSFSGIKDAEGIIACPRFAKKSR